MGPGCQGARVPVSAGTAYQIVVESDYDIAGNILLNLAYFERPPNDDFAARIHLDSGNVAATATNTAATTEPGETRSAFGVFGRSVWWSWTAPANGPVTMGVEASPFNPEAQIFEDVPGGTTGLSIFVGDSLATAMPVTNRASQHFTGAPDLCQVTFDAVVGTTYQIAADGTVDLFSALTLCIAQTEPPLVLLTSPLNNAEFVAGTPVTVAAEVLDPDGVVSTAEFFLEDLYGKGSRTYRVVTLPFRNTWSDLAPGEYDVTARATDNLGATADAIPIRFNVRPENDAFASRIALTGAFVTVTGTLANASSEPDEPSGSGTATVWWSWTAPGSGTFTITAASVSGDHYQGGSAWWSWTAPASGKVTISSSGSFWFLGAYTGTNLTSLVAVATNFSFGLSAQLTFDAVAGNEYQIACVSLARSLGRFQLALFLDARELRGPRLLPDGSAALDLRTTVERLWILEASTNLMDWAPIASGRRAASTVEFLDPTAASHPRWFYRAMAEP